MEVDETSSIIQRVSLAAMTQSCHMHRCHYFLLTKYPIQQLQYFQCWSVQMMILSTSAPNGIVSKGHKGRPPENPVKFFVQEQQLFCHHYDFY